MKTLSASLDITPNTSVLLNASVQKAPILSGLWTFDIRLGGETLSPVGRWTITCKHKERGCDYLEMDLPLDEGYRLQRCLLVNHNNQLLLLGDAVLADEDSPGSLSYRAEFSVSPTLRAKITDAATEIDFRPVRRTASRTAPSAFRVLPLALPEWRTAKQAGLVSGTLAETNGTLVLQQETTGQSLFAPLLFDLNASRLSKRYTWRQLSVGEDLQRVSEDQAVGYRIHLGQEQFLLYRSLTTSQANRTVLGHNLIDDFCFARFDPKKGVDPLIAVEVIE